MKEEYVGPRSELEESITEVWKEVLQLDKVGINDNFFDLGGNSLLMVKVHKKLQELFKKEYQLVELFKYSSVSALAQFLGEPGKTDNSYQDISDRARKQKQAISNRKHQSKAREVSQ
jgi:acyl carrier protein